MLYNIVNLVKTRQRSESYRLCIRSLKIAAGDKIALVGDSGYGKSTTLDILGLSLKPDSAEEFTFQPESEPGQNILELWRRNNLDALAALRLHHMGYVLQTGDLLPFLNVEENIRLTARMCGLDVDFTSKKLRLLLQKMGIEKLRGAMPATLSVGERQRAAIARALIASPQVILADEPTSALDPRHAGDVMDVFMDMVDQSGSTLILVTHNITLADQYKLDKICFRLDTRANDGTVILDRENP